MKQSINFLYLLCPQWCWGLLLGEAACANRASDWMMSPTVPRWTRSYCLAHSINELTSKYPCAPMWIYKTLINNRNSNFCIGAKDSRFLLSLWGRVTWVWASFVKVFVMIDPPLGLFNCTVCVKLPYLTPDSNTRDIPICLRLATFNSNKFSHKESVSFDCSQS